MRSVLGLASSALFLKAPTLNAQQPARSEAKDPRPVHAHAALPGIGSKVPTFKWIRWIALIAMVSVLTACDRRPINATAALPPPGEVIPSFEAPLLRGGTLSQASLRGSPAVIAVWSTTCPGSRKALHAMESLRTEYESRGVRFVILSADKDKAVLRQFADSARIGGEIAHIGPDVRDMFDRADSALERSTDRVLFALPSFLVVDQEGRVAARSGGGLWERGIKAALDSLTAAAAVES